MKDDLIRRRAAIESIRECAEAAHSMHDWDMEQGYLNAIECIEEEPSAQPEIIRCRDCIAYQEGIDIDGKPFTRCNGINGSVRTYGHTLPDWYCADAERRTDGSD